MSSEYFPDLPSRLGCQVTSKCTRRGVYGCPRNQFVAVSHRYSFSTVNGL